MLSKHKFWPKYVQFSAQCLSRRC